MVGEEVGDDVRIEVGGEVADDVGVEVGGEVGEEVGAVAQFAKSEELILPPEGESNGLQMPASKRGHGARKPPASIDTRLRKPNQSQESQVARSDLAFHSPGIPNERQSLLLGRSSERHHDSKDGKQQERPQSVILSILSANKKRNDSSEEGLDLERADV